MTKKTKKKSKKVKKTTCSDINCPVHGGLRTRGRVFRAKVIGDKVSKTISVEWPRRFYLSKYERFEKRRSRIKAHKPDCMDVKKGDKVMISECRPISKTKNFVVVEVLKQ